MIRKHSNTIKYDSVTIINNIGTFSDHMGDQSAIRCKKRPD